MSNHCTGSALPDMLYKQCSQFRSLVCLCSIQFTANGLPEETTALYDIARDDNDQTSVDLYIFVGLFTDMEAPQITWAEKRQMKIDDAPKP